MGRSPSFCFKIKACAGESPDDDDVSPPAPPAPSSGVSKVSPDKRRWSFRRRSDKHHVSNNTAIPDPLFNINEIFNSEIVPSAPEKTSTVEQLHERLSLPSVFVSSGSPEEITNTANAVVDCNIPEHVAIVIQTCIRGYLAQRELHKYKKIVKLQAAVRGYVIRRQAAGTFRCIQAIVKMQALVRARRSFKSAELTVNKKPDEDVQSDLVGISDIKLMKTHSVTRKLISNAFARQLMESTPMSKPIYISCDPLRLDSAWNWLERWMAVTTVDQQKLSLNQDDLGNDVNREIQSHVQEAFAVEEDKFTTTTMVHENSDNLTSQMQSDSGSHIELDNNSNKTHFADDAFENSSRKQLHETPDIGDNIENALIKSRYPCFTSVQSKFEDFSISGIGSCSYYSIDTVSESNAAQIQADSTSKNIRGTKPVFSKEDNMIKEFTLDEKLTCQNSIQGAPSVSGTEVSLDRSELGLTECVSNVKTDGETIVNAALNLEEMMADTDCHSSEIVAVEPKRMAESFENVSTLTSSAKTIQLGEQPVEQTSSAMWNGEHAEDKQVEGSSQDGSPRSHTTVTESHGAPSSPLDTDIQTVPVRKKMPQLAAKNSPTNSKNNSYSRSSDEYLRKDANSSKRQKSSGMAKTDHAYHENSSNSNSLPRYMKPTESAKAKVNTSISQKSSPDLHNKENYLKKRQSLPIDDGKQGSSPRMQRPTSLAQQKLKENEISSPSRSEMANMTRPSEKIYR